MTPRALIDASSAILLFKSGLIKASCELFSLLMTRSVFDEVSVPAQPGADELHALAGRQPGVTVLDHPTGALPNGAADVQRLHRGERDTLHHYLNGAARFVIIDDGRGVRVCRRHGIPHINALLCPRLLYFSGRMPDPHARFFFTRVAKLGRYSTAVVKWADTCEKSELSFFYRQLVGM
ncbi:hypothetical protein [uncultured Desulfosarcina sp.]|uniref:hypothetical protein n=1 Tax=uncultured Desulfosarcina sp. TaxID=218289 RepID=UPI0029C77F5C|nr:hypothetical protein [uncultured Desulfosarcina sp.]